MPHQIKFRLARTVALASLPDADPRTTPPDPVGAQVDQSQAGEMATQLEYGSPGELPRGHSVYLRFTNGAGGAEVIGPTCDFQSWAYDPGSLKWVSQLKELAAPSSQIYDSVLLGTLFVALSNPLTVGAATHVEVWITDRYAL